MQVFLYHPDTKEYVGSAEAPIDPLETEAQGKPVYLMPSNGTTVSPGEVPETHVARWTGEAWEILENHRNDGATGMGGAQYWLPGDHYYSVPRAMKELGSLPEEALLSPPEMTVEEALGVSERRYNDAQTQLALEMVPVIAEQLLGMQPTTLRAEPTVYADEAVSSSEESTADTAKVVNQLETLLASYNRNKMTLQNIKLSNVEEIKNTQYISDVL